MTALKCLIRSALVSACCALALVVYYRTAIGGWMSVSKGPKLLHQSIRLPRHGQGSEPRGSGLRPKGANRTCDPRLLILSISNPRTIESRLVPNIQTWVPTLGPEDKLITVIADPELKHTKVVKDPRYASLGLHQVDCPTSHRIGATCLVTEGMRILFPLMHNFDVIWRMDDDVFLVPRNLKAELCRDPSVQTFGCPGCGKDPFIGYCGGCGLGFVVEDFLRTEAKLPQLPQGEGTTLPMRKDISKSVGENMKVTLRPHTATPGDRFLDRFFQTAQAILDAGLDVWEDVTFGCTFKKLGLSVRGMFGLHGWPLGEKLMEAACTEKMGKPILFHYVDEATKRKLHSLINEGGCK